MQFPRGLASVQQPPPATLGSLARDPALLRYPVGKNECGWFHDLIGHREGKEGEQAVTERQRTV